MFRFSNSIWLLIAATGMLAGILAVIMWPTTPDDNLQRETSVLGATVRFSPSETYSGCLQHEGILLKCTLRNGIGSPSTARVTRLKVVDSQGREFLARSYCEGPHTHVMVTADEPQCYRRLQLDERVFCAFANQWSVPPEDVNCTRLDAE